MQSDNFVSHFFMAVEHGILILGKNMLYSCSMKPWSENFWTHESQTDEESHYLQKPLTLLGQRNLGGNNKNGMWLDCGREEMFT